MHFSDLESDNRIGSVMDDSVEMRAMAIDTGNTSHHDIESPNAQRYTTEEGWFSVPKFSKLSYSELVSYFGFRGVALLVLLKFVALVVFGYVLLASDRPSSDDYSVVSLASGRPSELRETIRQTSKGAVEAEPKALFTLQTATDLLYDGYIEFILSFPVSKKESSDNTDGSGWQSSKDIVSTVSKFSSIEDIKAARSDGKAVADPLAIDTIDPALVVHRFAEGAEDSSAVQPFSIVLNKFNTVKDHSLIVTDEYAPQLTPLSAAELELWHWTLLQTRGVGFYNSNLMAGASQAHKHMQLIPGDVIWALRNPDAAHALPIDDTIMPRIESGRWRPYPRKLRRSTSTSGEGSGNSSVDAGKSKYWYATSLQAKQRFQAGYLHQLPQFDFQHAAAVLLDRSAFIQDPHPLRAYSDYLRRVYEALLLVNGISLSDLETCADADPLGGSARRLAQRQSSHSVRPISYDTDDLISEGSYRAPSSTGSSPSPSTGTGISTSTAGGSKKLEAPPKPLDCLRDVGYNLILRPQYMLLVPRGQKDFQGQVNVNGFGYMGMFLAMSEESKQMIKQAGPLEILKTAGRKLTVRCGA